VIALLQRVASARVEVGGRVIGAIGPGLLMLVCAEPDDSDAIADKLVAKVLKLRIFADEAGKMNRSLPDIGGGLLVVSQFTLFASTRKGRRPGWSRAAPGETGEPLVEALCRALEAEGAEVHRGRFGAHMQVASINDGPITILIDTLDWE